MKRRNKADKGHFQFNLTTIFLSLSFLYPISNAAVTLCAYSGSLSRLLSCLVILHFCIALPFGISLWWMRNFHRTEFKCFDHKSHGRNSPKQMNGWSAIACIGSIMPWLASWQCAKRFSTKHSSQKQWKNQSAGATGRHWEARCILDWAWIERDDKDRNRYNYLAK